MAQEDRFIDVIRVSGPLDERIIDFTIDTIREVEESSELIIVQLDAPAAVSDGIWGLFEVISDPAAPLAVWVGPETAVAYGGALGVLAVAPLRMAAPGATVGAGLPYVAGQSSVVRIGNSDDPVIPDDLRRERTTVSGPIDGLVDEVHPGLVNIIQALDGRTISVRGTDHTIAVSQPGDDGDLQPIPTRFHEPGLIDRALRLSLSPAVAYWFLLLGLSIAAFEFYAAGVGVAAGVSVLAIFLSGYGLATLPVNWWALGLGVLGLGFYLFDFQRVQLRLASVLGTVAMVVGARYFVHEPPQLSMAWWSAAVIVLSIALFFLFAMTTVVRARFSTPTIGREHLVGKRGTAETAVAPEGVVVVDGARWKANSRRASGIDAGDEVVIAAVEGIVLEVDPI